MNRKQIIVLWVLLIVLIPIVVIFSIIVWPTKYKYLPSEGAYLALRINRFTGETEGLHRVIGWKKFQEEKETEIKEYLSAKKQPLPLDIIPVNLLKLPPEEVNKIDTIYHVNNYGGGNISTDFTISLYNGSLYNLMEITITITAKEGSGAIRWSRQFKRGNLNIAPEESGKITIEIPSVYGADISWMIDKLKGTPIIK